MSWMPPQVFSSYGRTRSWASLRSALCLLAFAWLVACSSHTGTISSQVPDQRREAEEYAARARRNYEPPGPPEDPWRPYIAEASQRFDVPERWIREVMRVESGGKQYVNGQLITSPKGALGLTPTIRATISWRGQPTSGKCIISMALRLFWLPITPDLHDSMTICSTTGLCRAKRAAMWR